MSKVHLKKLLNCTEIPKIIIYFDRWDLCGRCAFWTNVKSHLKVGRGLHYVCYGISPHQCTPFIKYDDGEALKFYDFFTDPCQWNGGSGDCLDATKGFTHLLNLSQLESEKKMVIVVDGLAEAAKYMPETDILRDINEMKNAASVLQVIVYCHEDMISHSFTSALKNISSATVSMESFCPFTCKVLIKKASGKVLQSWEEFRISEELELEYAREHHPADVQSNKESIDEEDIALQTTFNLSLTDSQRRAKNKLVLPHTRIQSTGGQIHYVPDAEDDWDDEDPDDDLEI